MRLLLAADEAEREGGERRAERQAAERVIGHAPDRGAHGAHGLLARILRERLGDARRSPTAHARRGRMPRRSAPAPSRRAAARRRPRTARARSREARAASALVLRADELGRLHHEVAHELGVDRQGAHREHGRRRVEQAARRERAPTSSSACRRKPQAHRAVADAGRAPGEGEHVRCGGRHRRRSKRCGHPTLNYNTVSNERCLVAL